MPAKKVVKESPRGSVKKATKPASTARLAAKGRRSAKPVSKRVRPLAAAKPARVQAPVPQVEARPAPSTHPGPDPKAERTREHMKHMKGIESQRNEERHRMTRFRRNTP
jgi:hypothetical protein